MKKLCDAWSIISLDEWNGLEGGISHLGTYDQSSEWHGASSSEGQRTLRRLIEERLPNYQGHYPHCLYRAPAFSSKSALQIVRQTVNSDVEDTGAPLVILRIRAESSRFLFATDYAILRLSWEHYVARTLEEMLQFDQLLEANGLEEMTLEQLPASVRQRIIESWNTNVFIPPGETRLWPSSTFAFIEYIGLKDIVSTQSVMPGSILYPAS